MHLVSPIPVQPLLAVTPPSGPTYTKVFAGDKAIGSDPTVQDYFNNGEFPAGMANPENQLPWIITGAVVNSIPLVRSLMSVARLLPPLRRTVDDAIERNNAVDKINLALGTVEDTFGRVRNWALPVTLAFIGLSLYHDTFRILSCYIPEIFWGAGGALGAFYRGSVNKALLGRRFVTPYKLYLHIRGRRDELAALNQKIEETRLQRRHYLGPLALSLPTPDKKDKSTDPLQPRGL